MQKKLAIILSCIVTLCLTVSLLGYLTNLMERKTSNQKYADFLSQDENFDVLFMGNSHVINAVYPMELWKDYGIVSYNMGGHSNQIATSYWVMENALDYTTPKLVVIDCSLVSSNWKGSDIFAYLHLSLDAFSLSKTKIKAIWDILDDPYLEEAIANGTARESDEPRTKLGLLWDYSVYHNRWTEIDRDDFDPYVSPEKGAEIRINVANGTLDRIDLSQKMEAGTVAESYLRRMIEDCQNRGIDVLLTYMPFTASEEEQKEANYIYDLAEEYGVNYINFLDTEVINYPTDLYDDYSHVNPSGGRKITAYLGEYIRSNYSVEDQRDNPAFSFWNQDYDEYVELKDGKIRSQEILANYLMLLSGDKTEIELDIYNKDILNNELFKELLKNIGVNQEDISCDIDRIIIPEKQNEAIVVKGLTDRNDGEGLRVKVIRDGNTVDEVNFIYTVDPGTFDINMTAVNRD